MAMLFCSLQWRKKKTLLGELENRAVCLYLCYVHISVFYEQTNDMESRF